MDKTYVERIAVSHEDKVSMRTDCKELFLKEHPEFIGFKISDGFMFKRLVQYYLK